VTDDHAGALAAQQAADEIAAILHDRIVAAADRYGKLTAGTIAGAIVELALTTSWRAHRALAGMEPEALKM